MNEGLYHTDYINQFNYLAIELLECIGNTEPTQAQIDLTENILSTVTIKCQLRFSQHLNKEETACLYWAARGKSSKETAQLIHTSQARVESYRKEIKRKLGCANITQSVFEGIRLGVFTDLSKKLEECEKTAFCLNGEEK